MYVDGVLARLSLVEAKNRRLTDKVNTLTNENALLKAELNNENTLLKADLNNVNKTLKDLQQTTSNLTSELSLVQQDLLSQPTDPRSECLLILVRTQNQFD